MSISLIIYAAVTFAVLFPADEHQLHGEDRPICVIRMEVRLADDVAQPFGSMFEMLDAAGHPIAGAYVPESSSLFHRSEGRRAVFFVEPAESESVKLERLGRPFPNKPAGTLYTLQDRLFAVVRPQLDSETREFKDGQWIPVPEGCELSQEGFAWALPIQGQLMTASHRGVSWGNTLVFAPEPNDAAKYFYYYSGGKLLAYRYGDTDSGVQSQVLAFRWSPGEPTVDRTKAFLTETLPIDYPLCFGSIGDRLVFATNSTKRVYSIGPSGMDCIYEHRGTESWQGYVMVRYRGRLLIGQYPQGQCYSTDGRVVERWGPDLPLTSAWSWELQSMGFLRGQLLAGVWPWGQVFKFDGKRWSLWSRAFTAPPVADEECPYWQECSAANIERNAWGQRINSIVTFQGSTFLSTMNKGGNAETTEIIGERAQEYGMVARCPAHNQLDWALRWKSKTSFVFRIWQGRAEVEQDGELVASGIGSFGRVTELNRVKWGEGVAGEICGLISTAQIEVHGRTNAALDK